MEFAFPDYYLLTPEPCLRARAARAAERCAGEGLDGLLLTSGVDLYYLTGTMQQGAAFVTKEGRVGVFLRRHAGRGAAETPLETIAVSGLTEMAKRLGEVFPSGAKLGLMLDLMSARDHLGWRGRLPGLDLVDASALWADLKAVKDRYEIELMRQSGAKAAAMYSLAPDLIRAGVSEAYVAGELLTRCMELGGIDLMRSRGGFLDLYTFHVVSGPEGSVPSSIDAAFSGFGPSPALPAGAGPKRIRTQEPVIVDIGMNWHGYISDQARTYCVGPAPDMVHRAHECLLAVEELLLDNLRPGAVNGELFRMAVDIAESHGMGEYFLGRPGHRITFAGHGVGLELGGPPYLVKGGRTLVRAGEVYALELKIVLDEGPVGLENTVLVHDEGPAEIISTIGNQLFEL